MDMGGGFAQTSISPELNFRPKFVIFGSFFNRFCLFGWLAWSAFGGSGDRGAPLERRVESSIFGLFWGSRSPGDMHTVSIPGTLFRTPLLNLAGGSQI
jgi:hypothetical protein